MTASAAARNADRFTGRILGLVTCVCCLYATTACTGVTDPQEITFPDSSVSYVRHMQPFLNLSCANGGCHDKTSPPGGIDLTDYTGLMFSRANLAVPNKPDES